MGAGNEEWGNGQGGGFWGGGLSKGRLEVRTARDAGLAWGGKVA